LAWRLRTLVAGRPRGQISIHFLTRNTVDLRQMVQGIGLAVWAAIEQFQTAAMAPEREPRA
jgi:hypothetical protein